MASGDGSPMTTPPPGPAYTPDNIQRMQQVLTVLLYSNKGPMPGVSGPYYVLLV